MKKAYQSLFLAALAVVVSSSLAWSGDTAMPRILSVNPSVYKAKITSLPGHPYASYYIIYGRFDPPLTDAEAAPEASCSGLAEEGVHLRASYYGRDAGEVDSWCRDLGSQCAFRCIVKLEALNDRIHALPYAIIGPKYFRFVLTQTGSSGERLAQSPEIDLLGGDEALKTHPPWRDVVGPWSDADGDEVPDDIDNCVAQANFDQADTDGDGVGDVCAVVRPLARL